MKMKNLVLKTETCSSLTEVFDFLSDYYQEEWQTFYYIYWTNDKEGKKIPVICDMFTESIETIASIIREEKSIQLLYFEKIWEENDG